MATGPAGGSDPRTASSRPRPAAPSPSLEQEEPHFLRRQHGGRAFGRPRPWGVQARQLDAEYLLIQEQQGMERLDLHAGRDAAVDRQIREKPLDLRSAHGAGVSLMPWKRMKRSTHST
jgi:hypothetical protein